MRVALLLAAGSSRRWGAANKLLARIGGESMVVASLRIARAAPVGRVVVIVGAQAERVARAVRAARVPGVEVVRARDHSAGVGASLRAGLAALRPAERTVFVFLGDMPTVPPTLARRLARALRPGDAAVRPVWRGVPGHPVLLRRPSRAAIGRIGGDRGLGPLLAGARTIAAGRGAVRDVDRRTDLPRAR